MIIRETTGTYVQLADYFCLNSAGSYLSTRAITQRIPKYRRRRQYGVVEYEDIPTTVSIKDVIKEVKIVDVETEVTSV